MTSEQAPCWAKRVEALRAQKGILEATKAKKEFDAVKRTN